MFSFVLEKEVLMNKVLKIEGLDCGHCAKVLEDELKKLDCAKNIQVNFIKSTISFESDNPEEATDKIIHLTKMVEPDAKIIDERVLTKKKFNPKLFINFVVLILGAGIGLCGIYLFEESIPWLFWLLYVAGALVIGWKTYFKALKLLMKGVINENFLITLSIIGATVVGEYMEGIMVVTLYSIGKILESLAVNKSRKSIKQLTSLKSDYAIVVKGENEEKVDPKSVKIGSIILVRPGERVPIDGKIVSGKATLDTQSLTGESVPVSAKEGNTILSGSMVLDGVLKIKTTSEYPNSTISRIMNFIENAAEKKSKTETFISKFTKWYTLVVLTLSLSVWGIGWLATGNFNEWLYKGLIFLVISCPCAFAISVPLSYFSGIGNASSKGILIKGSNYLDACTKLNVVAFDKTGTLTTGQFKIEKVIVFEKSCKEDDIIHIASIGEQHSLHPLAKSIVLADKLPMEKAENITEKAGEGVYFTYKQNKYFVGRKSEKLDSTIVELFKQDTKLGEIHLTDSIKESSYKVCHELASLNVKTVLLSGDNKKTVGKVAKEIGIKEYYGRLLPEDKYEWIVNEKKSKKSVVGYVGDGINDAPSLMAADVGISMGINASSASIEASDVVLVDDNPQKVETAIKISKFTRKIVWQNIIFAMIMKITFLALGEIGVTGIIGAVIADVGVTLLAILNSMRALRYTPKELQKHQHNHSPDKRLKNKTKVAKCGKVDNLSGKTLKIANKTFHSNKK